MSAELVTGLQCRLCGKRYPKEALNFCTEDFGPLEVAYDYEAVARTLTRSALAARPRTMWRYHELLPIDGEPTVGRHVGGTPLIRADRLARVLGLRELYLKNDAVNHPSLSFKDRVVAVALSKAVELGFQTVGCASTGNLAGSVAANAAAAGLEAYVLIPDGLEQGKVLGATIYGARVIAVQGNYDHVNRLCSQIAFRYGWGFVNVNLRPYYAEGSKSMGFEIAEDLGWRAPDHVVAPMAGGSLIGKIHKAFQEFERLDLLEAPVRTRMFGAQATGCNPISATVKIRRRQGQTDPPSRHDREEPGDRRPRRRLLRLEADRRDRRLERGRRRRGHRRCHDPARRNRGDLGRDRRRRDPRRGDKADRARQDRPRGLHGPLHHRQRPEDPGGSGRQARQAGGHRAHHRSLREPGRIARPLAHGQRCRGPGRQQRVSGRPGLRGFHVQGPKPISMENDTMATVRIPTPLRPHAGGQDRVESAGATVGEVLANLGIAFPTFRERLFDGEELRRFVNVYLNNEDIRYLDDLATPVAENDEVSIIPAVAGG